MIFHRILRRLIRDYPCRDFVEAVTDYLEGSMPVAERRRFERHLRRCDGCDRYLAQMRTTIHLTGRLTTADVDALGPAARSELMEAFRSYHAGRR